MTRLAVVSNTEKDSIAPINKNRLPQTEATGLRAVLKPEPWAPAGRQGQVANTIVAAWAAAQTIGA